MQELSIEQSSLFVQAIAIGGIIAGFIGRCIGGSVGRMVGNSTSGGRILVVSFPGTIVESWGGLGVSVSGRTVVGRSVATALQWSVGFPIVPGGQEHTGLWPKV